jgi:carboxyl-terminal processing protease
MHKNFSRFILPSFFIASALVLVFSFGYIFGQQNRDISIFGGGSGQVYNKDATPAYLSNDINFNEFWQVWTYVKENYVKPDVAESQLFYGALRGLVDALDDPYSVFLDPEITERFAQELSGNFEGIGAEIGIRNDRLTIIAPLADTPAERAGLRSGDYILAIDGEDTTNISLDYAVSNIRGPKGSQVVLSIFTLGDEGPRDVPITRSTIEIDSVRLTNRDGTPITNGAPQLLEGDIAYIELLFFNENTLADWNRTTQDILALSPQGIILDLRNNPGGFLGTAIEVAGEWVNGKTVVMEQLRDGTRIEHTAERKARFADIPTVVLINQGSASGAEIVAGALHDYGVATLVGETTFGKGSVQDLRQFRDGSSVKLTVAEWLTPNGFNINQAGIAPDIEVALSLEDFTAGLDPQLDRALEILTPLYD